MKSRRLPSRAFKGISSDFLPAKLVDSLRPLCVYVCFLRVYSREGCTGLIYFARAAESMIYIGRVSHLLCAGMIYVLVYSELDMREEKMCFISVE